VFRERRPGASGPPADGLSAAMTPGAAAGSIRRKPV